jgi:hypothetical protein
VCQHGTRVCHDERECQTWLTSVGTEDERAPRTVIGTDALPALRKRM